METKVCTKCNRILPIDDFNWRDKKRGIRRSECKYCHCEFMKQIYESKRSEITKIKSSLKCQKCGESKEYKLDFHHNDPREKDSNVCRLISGTYNIKRVLEEVKKCTVLCSNCHREFHHYNDKYGISLEEYLENDCDLD